MKICKTCNATEDLIGFRKDRRICNNCLKKNKQEYYLSNHKETREHQNKYRELNRYKINAQKREHYKLNSERIRKQNAEYAKNNRDKRNINKDNRKKVDTHFKLRITISGRIRQALKNHLIN